MKLHLSLLVSLSSFGLFACSDAPPQPPAIGIQVIMQPPLAANNPDERRCPAQPNGSRTYTVGAPDGDHTVENGKDGVELTCTIKESGDVYFQLFSPNRTTNLTGVFAMTLKGRVVSKTDATQNSASVSFSDSANLGALTTPAVPGCTLGPVAPATEITLQPGALFASFSCPLLTAPNSPGDGCQGTGKFAIEYCNTGEEEE
jgi:hypothetical protein